MIKMIAGSEYLHFNSSQTLSTNSVASHTDMERVLYNSILTTTDCSMSQTFTEVTKFRFQSSLPHSSSGVVPFVLKLELQIDSVWTEICKLILPINLDDSGENYRYHIDFVYEGDPCTGIRIVKESGGAASSIVYTIAEYTTRTDLVDTAVEVIGTIVAQIDEPLDVVVTNNTDVFNTAIVSAPTLQVENEPGEVLKVDITSSIDVPVVNGSTKLATDDTIVSPIPLPVTLAGGGAADIWDEYWSRSSVNTETGEGSLQTPDTHQRIQRLTWR